jgi:hypothetical protein
MKKSRIVLYFVIFSGLFLALALLPGLAKASEPQELELQAVWARVVRSGAFRFITDLTQTNQNAWPDGDFLAFLPPTMSSVTNLK